MPIESIMDAARAGMNYERLRLDAASRNVAAANVPVTPGQPAKHWRVDPAIDGFGRLVGPEDAHAQDTPVREVYDPGHPLADSHGIVRYPATDMVQEMTTLMTASRGYEANVRSFNLLRGMMLRALEIGAK
jgi:flagellar basal-body rod protein FlgC